MLSTLLSTLLLLVPADANATALDVVLTADTAGRVSSCASGPGTSIGGIARRATAIKTLRRTAHPIVLDAGNFLFGDESLDSEGAVVIDSYAELAYDAINVSWREFHFGRDVTTERLGDTDLPIISCNLMDATTGDPLFDAHVMIERGGQRIAIIGATERPPAMPALPHLSKQLEGIEIVDPRRAVPLAVASARVHSDRVILVWYGSAVALKAVRAECHDDLVVVAGGLRDNTGQAARLTALDGDHTMTVGRLEGEATTTETVELDASIQRDPRVSAVIEMYLEEPTRMAAGDDVDATPGTGGNDPITRVAPDVMTDSDVDRAIERGADFLWTRLLPRVRQSRPLIRGDRDYLAVLALVHTGAHHRLPEFDLALQEFLTTVTPETLLEQETATTRLGVLCMLIDAYGLPDLQPKLALAARYLVETQGADGSWSDGLALAPDVLATEIATCRLSASAFESESGTLFSLREPTGADWTPPALAPWTRRTPWLLDVSGDNAATTSALLGLRSAHRRGIPVPDETWERALAILRERQSASGGWNVRNELSSRGASGNMTCAAVSAIAIARDALGASDPTDDPAITRGRAWLDHYFDATHHPRDGARSAKPRDQWYAYLASIERVSQVLDVASIGGVSWYTDGARALLTAQQSDGAWKGNATGYESDPAVATSLALLFLTRGTEKIEQEASDAGYLFTRLETGPPSDLYFVLDASGSMRLDASGRSRLDIARDRIHALVKDVAPDRTLALRIYGGVEPNDNPARATNSRLLVPLRRWRGIQPQRFAAHLDALTPDGNTPIGFALNETVKDLRAHTSERPMTVVLISDGGADGDPTLAACVLGALPNVRLFVVGYDVSQPEWAVQLRSIALSAGGSYMPAAHALELAAVLDVASGTPPRHFQVLDANGEHLVTEGAFGQAETLVPGSYRVQLRYGGRLLEQPMQILAGSRTTLIVNVEAAVDELAAVVEDGAEGP